MSKEKAVSTLMFILFSAFIIGITINAIDKNETISKMQKDINFKNELLKDAEYCYKRCDEVITDLKKENVKLKKTFFLFKEIEKHTTPYLGRYKPQDLKEKKIVIIGSYHYYFELVQLIYYFENHGAIVLAPIKSEVVDANVDFPLLKADAPDASPKALQETVNRKIIDEADIVYVANFRYMRDGKGKVYDLGEPWIGLSTSFEYGIAHSHGKYVVCAEEPMTANHKFFCDYQGKNERKIDKQEKDHGKKSIRHLKHIKEYSLS
jgi:hypothetical protein